MSKATNEERKTRPWPAPSESPPAADGQPAVVTNREKPTKIDDRVRQEMDDVMADLFERQAEQYEYDDPKRPKAPPGGF